MCRNGPDRSVGLRLTRYYPGHVGCVFQYYCLEPSLTARETIRAAGVAPDPMPATETFGLVDPGQRRDLFPSSISRGEQHRVALDCAISKRPEILRCDEATSAWPVG